MRHRSLILAAIFLAATAIAQEPKAYQEGVLSQMDSVPCPLHRNNASDARVQAELCREYTLQTDRVVYRFRSRSPKHPILLPVGERVQFRMDKNKFLLRKQGVDSKERQYTLVAVTPRSETTVDVRPIHLNHLQ
jgi:hypothetical protein